MGRVVTIKERREVIKHYEEMIAWVRVQKGGDFPYNYQMKRDIGQNWQAEFCVLCTKYTAEDHCCIDCPLFENDMNCNSEGSWRRLNRAVTWDSWLIWTRSFLEEFKELPWTLDGDYDERLRLKGYQEMFVLPEDAVEFRTRMMSGVPEDWQEGFKEVLEKEDFDQDDFDLFIMTLPSELRVLFMTMLFGERNFRVVAELEKELRSE